MLNTYTDSGKYPVFGVDGKLNFKYYIPRSKEPRTKRPKKQKAGTRIIISMRGKAVNVPLVALSPDTKDDTF